MTEDNRLVVIEDSAQLNRWDALNETLRSILPWAFMAPPPLPGAAGTDLSSKIPWGLRKLKDGLDKFAPTIMLEPHYVCKDHRNLHSNFYSKKFQERSATCARLHFFSKAGICHSTLLFNPASLKEHYIGYSVIRPVPERCLGRTVIDPYMVGRHIADGFTVCGRHSQRI